MQKKYIGFLVMILVLMTLGKAIAFANDQDFTVFLPFVVRGATSGGNPHPSTLIWQRKYHLQRYTSTSTKHGYTNKHATLTPATPSSTHN